MSTKRIVLRQHIRGSDSGPTRDLNLSLGEQEISYGIILNPLSEHLEIIDQDAMTSLACVRIHTQHGFVCVEAMKPMAKVQSLPSGFDGTSSNGIMPLKVSNDNERVLYQLHPGESLFVGSRTISIVPEQYRDIPVSPSGYDSFRERVSQNVSQIQSSSRLLETPTRNQIPSILSSPAQSKSAVKQTATSTTKSNDDSQEWNQDPAKRNLLGVIRDISRKRKAESPCGQSMILENLVTSVIEAVTVRPGNQTDGIIGLQSDDTTIDWTIERRIGDYSNHDQETEISGDDGIFVHLSQSSPMRNTPRASEDQARDGEDFEADRVVEGPSGRKSAQSDPPYANTPKSSKRQKLMETASGSPVSETQDSLRSNIVVQGPAQTPKSVVQDATSTNHSSSPQMAKSAELNAESIQRNGVEPPAGILEPKSSMRSIRSLSKENLNSNPSQSVGLKILFASSTSVDSSKQFMRWLEKRGVKQVFNMADCTALCVSRSSELKKTSKLILAVLHGKQIVTDDWVTQSISAGKLLDLEDFKASDPRREAEWRINLDQAIERGRHMTPKPFDGWTIAFTSAAKKDAGTNGFNDLKEIALYAGAKSCSCVLPKKPPKQNPSTLVIACQNDPASETLQGTWRLFSREIIGLTILRGQLDIESDEFLVRSEPGVSKRKEDRKRK